VVQGLRPYDPSPSRKDERGDAGYAQAARLDFGRLAPGTVGPAGERLPQPGHIDPRLFSRPSQDLDAPYVLRTSEIRIEDLPVELRVPACVAGELRGLNGQTRVGQQHRRLKMQPQLDAAPPQAFLAEVYARSKEPFEKDAFRRRLRMDLVAHPLVLQRELFFQPIDNTRADVAERSYVVGEYPDRNRLAAHLIYPISSRPPRLPRG
jgi:hypothetical protein